MFFKLLRYDLKNGFLSTYKRYMVSIVAFCLMFVHFMVSVYNHNMGAKPEVPLEGSLGNALLFCLGGMQKYPPGRTGAFELPVFWMFICMFTAYITLYYPFDDLEESGQNILIRSGGRQLWWLSKCLWNLTSVVVFFLLAWGIMVLGCLITGNSLSMEISPEMSKILVLDPDNYPSLPIHVIPQTFLLMPLTVAAINLLQMTVSLFVKPLISFIITTAILLLSAYYTTPILIGNYSMPLRSDWMLVNGVNFTVGIVFSVVLILVSVMVGGVVFQRRDILKGEEDG